MRGNLMLPSMPLGHLDDAVANCRRALSSNPIPPRRCNNLGNALKALGHFDDTVASYRRALEIKPTTPKAHYNLGNALQDFQAT
jgi:Flp pilus assembly protein TadD